MKRRGFLKWVLGFGAVLVAPFIGPAARTSYGQLRGTYARLAGRTNDDD